MTVIPGPPPLSPLPPKVTPKSFPGACLSVRIGFCVSYHVLSLEETSRPSWRKHEGSLCLCRGVQRQGTPGQHLGASAPLRNIPVSPIPSLLRRLDVRTTFPVAFIFQQFQKSVLRYNAQRKKRTYPFPFLYLYLRTRKMFLRGLYLGPINPLFHWSELDLLFMLNPVTGKRNGISLMGLDRSGFTPK